jgi:hypothetical protein
MIDTLGARITWSADVIYHQCRKDSRTVCDFQDVYLVVLALHRHLAKDPNSFILPPKPPNPTSPQNNKKPNPNPSPNNHFHKPRHPQSNLSSSFSTRPQPAIINSHVPRPPVPPSTTAVLVRHAANSLVPSLVAMSN